MPKYPTAEAAIANNEKYRCAAPGCTEHRAGLSKYCLYHRRRAQKYGHPHGSTIVGPNGHPMYNRELDFTHDLLIRNINSKPVQAALNILGQWLNAAKGGLAGVPGERLLKTVDDVEAIALPILEDVTAAYIYCLEVKNVSDDELTFALAIALFRHIPRKYVTVYSVKKQNAYKVPQVRMGKLERVAIGQYIRNELGVFLANVHQHWKTSTERKQATKQDLLQPIQLNINPKEI